MERQVLLIRKDQREKLEKMADQENVSIAEINRRAIDQFFYATNDEMRALNLLSDTLIEANKRAEQALIKMEKSIDAFLKTKRK